MGTKTEVSFASIFMAHIETTILSRTILKPSSWKHYKDDIFSLRDTSKPDIEAFIEQGSLHHPTIKFTAEISDTETAFLHTVVYKSTRFNEKLIYPWCKDKFKKEETFQYTYFTSRHPPNVKKDLSKGKPWESYELTPQKQRLRKIFQISKNVWLTEATHKFR